MSPSVGAASDRPLRSIPMATILAVVVFYATGSLLAWHGFGANVGLAFFPPAGVTTAALILSDRRHWPPLLGAIFSTEVIVDLSQQLELVYSVGYGVANTVEPLVAALAFQRLNRARASLEEWRGKFSYLFGACGIGALAGALIGATVVTQHRRGTSWTNNVVHWWAGDGVAILAIGASIVLLATTPFSSRQRAELLLGAVVTAAASIIGLTSLLPPSTIVLPVLTVLAFRVGPAGATVGGSVVALVANYSTNAGHGYFADLDISPSARLSVLQLFIAALVIVAWSIGVEVLARVRAVSVGVELAAQRDEATAAFQAIRRAIAPQVLDTAGPFTIGSCYRQSSVDGLAGGDWFDSFVLLDGRLMFVVGDVVGHGVDAMEDMAHLRLATRAFASEGHGPARILTELNLYAQHSTRGRFATMVIAIYEPSRRRVTFACAGHPPPLVRRRRRQSEYLPIRPGVPLGVPYETVYEQLALTLAAGDTIVLYTDGVVERRGHTLDEGFRALSRALDGVSLGDDPDAICRQLVDETFTTVEAEDDRCLLMVQVTRVRQQVSSRG